MEDIRINGKAYRWYYQERDGNHWYIPRNSKPSFNTKGRLLTPEELKRDHGIDCI